MLSVEIPDELLNDAELAFARNGLSLSSVLQQLLKGYVSAACTPMPGNYELLLRYSLGQISECSAMEAFHLDEADSLRAMTVGARLPLPRLPEKDAAAMQKNFGEMLDRFGTNAK